MQMWNKIEYCKKEAGSSQDWLNEEVHFGVCKMREEPASMIARPGDDFKIAI